jgi:hypothetical protein
MKLLVHIGLHKTGSTWLQQMLLDNRTALALAGFWYADTVIGYPAHHPAADVLLVGDGAPLAEMVLDARRAGCHTVILSSENLEGRCTIRGPRRHRRHRARLRCGTGRLACGAAPSRRGVPQPVRSVAVSYLCRQLSDVL